jgi:thiol:disulfide interchange protein DsbC
MRKKYVLHSLVALSLIGGTSLFAMEKEDGLSASARQMQNQNIAKDGAEQLNQKTKAKDSKDVVITDANRIAELSKMNKALRVNDIVIKGFIDRGSDYFIKIETSPSATGNIPQRFFAFLNKDNKEIHIGATFDKDGVAVKFPLNKAVIDRGVSFTLGEGDTHVYLVTDPDCPFCIDFEKQMSKYFNDKKYTVHVILLPLAMHPTAPAIIEWISRGENNKERAERFRRATIERDTSYKSIVDKDGAVKERSNEQVRVHNDRVNALLELGANRTPTMLDSKFNLINPATVLIPHKEEAKSPREQAILSSEKEAREGNIELDKKDRDKKIFNGLKDPEE